MDLFGIYKSDEEVNREIISKVKGLKYEEEFISTDEERALIEDIENQPWLDDLKRKVQHYGYKYDYRARRINQSFKIGEINQVCMYGKLHIVNLYHYHLFIHNFRHYAFFV